MDEPMDGPYFHIDELNRIMYRQFRESSIENQDFLHMWPHWFLLTAIRNTDFSLFVEIMDDIKSNIFKESTSIHFENLFQSTPYKNFFNRTLGDMYLNIVQRNGLNQFKQFLLNGGAQFNTMSDLHNKYKSFTQFVCRTNYDIKILTIFIEQKTRNIEVKIEVSLHIGIGWDDDIKYAYMLISKGVSTDIFDQHSMFVHFEKMRHDIVRLILAEELLNIPKEHNYHKIIQDILGKVIESPINLNVIRNTAVIDGHNVLRKLLKLQPRLINDLIMNAYQLLKISSREINNATDRSEYLQRILEHKIDVCGNDGNEIFRMLQLHNTEDEEFNFFEIPMTVENYLPRLNYICILCCKLIHPCHLCSQTKCRILQERNRSRGDGNSGLTKRLKVFYFNREIKFIQQEIKRNSEEHVDLLASLLKKVRPYKDYYFFIIERILITLLHIVVSMNDLICAYMLLCKAASVLIYTSNKRILDKAIHSATQNGNVDMKTLLLMARQEPPDINSYKVFEVFRNLQIPPIKKETLEFFLDNCGETVCLKVLKEGFHDELNYSVAKDLLNIAIRRNYCQIIREILKNFEFDSVSFDSRESLNSFKQSIVLLGVTDGNPIVVRELLKLKPQVTDDLIINVYRRLRMSDDRLECLKLILEHVNVRCTDDLGNTPLHYALEANNYEAAILLLKQGSYLGHMNKSKNIAIANIPAFVLSSYFNDCIQLKDEWTDKCTIEFDYRCLMPHDDLEEQQETYQTTREMEVISYIANNDTLKHLLKHPLLSSFLYIKWYKIRHVLYANFVFYMMFYFFLNAYILNMTYTTPSKSGKQITNDSSNMVFANTLESTCSQDISLWIIVVEMLLIFTGRNLLQFLFSPRHYLTDLKNWSQILLIVLTLTLLCGAGFQIAVIVILLSTWELITLIHLLPSTSTTIEMFQTVFFNFVRFFFPYMFLVLAFALVFHMLFTNDIHFSNPDLSLFKTIIMLTGEFDANDISFSVYPVWSRLVFVLFIFNMVIVLLNLLKGVAISDIAKILYKAEIIRLISQIHLIIYFERMIIGKPFCWHSRWIWRNLFNFVSGRIFLFPYFLEDGKVSFKLYDNLNVYDKDMCLNRWFSLKMDPNIIKNAKQIVCNKNNLSNDNIMDELAKLQARLAQIKRTLKRY